MIVFLICALILLIIGYIYVKLIHRQYRCYKIFHSQGIPGEKFIPIVGQMLDMMRASKDNQDVNYFHNLANKHGSKYLFGFGPLTRLVMLDGDYLCDILGRPNCENYRKPKDLVDLLQPIIGIHNLIISDGKEHERSRHMLNPAFYFNNLKSMVSIMTNETMKTIDCLLMKSSSSKPIDLDPEFNTLTLSIIASSLFGQSFETISNAKELVCCSFEQVKELMAYRTLHLINQIKFLAILPFWGKLTIDRNVKKMNDFIDQVINDRRNGKSSSLCSGEDILDLLLSAVDDQGCGFSDEEIRNQALTFMLAGHETTGNLMTWIFHILMKHPDVYQECIDEINRFLPNQCVPQYEDLSQFLIIDAVIYETLRLYPSAPFFVREAIQDHYIGSNSKNSEQKQIFVPKESMIVIHAYALHRREEYWSNPLEFNYQRWLRDPTTGLKPKLTHPFAYLPFAAGPRNCIGQNFAILEAKVMLIMMIQHCEFKLIPGQIIVPEMKGVTMRPKHGVLAQLTKRSS